MVLILGEIDCRESMLQAVERDYYSSLEEAMTTTIKGFTQVLKELVAARKFQVR